MAEPDERLPALVDGKFFTITSRNENKISVKCMLCPNKQLTAQIDATSNLLKHLKSTHGTKVKEYEEHKRTVAQKRSAGSVDLESSAKKPRLDDEDKKQVSLFDLRQKKSDKDDVEVRVIRYIVKEMLPLCTVEKESFRELLQIPVMCRKTLSVRLDEKSALMLTSLRQQLGKQIAVCTTADIWTCLKKSYLGVTAHWLSEDLKRQSAALACSRLKGSHTYDVVAENLIGINTKYGLDHRSIIFTVTDNGSNMVKAFSENQEPSLSTESMDLSDSDEDEAVLMESDCGMVVESVDVNTILGGVDNLQQSAFLPKHIRCASHTFNLVTTTDFQKILSKESCGCKQLMRSAFAKCTKLWNNVSRSTKSTDAAMDVLGVSIRAPGETRWNATFDAIKRLMEPRIRHRLAQLMDTLKLPQFSKIELEVLDEYLKFMAPIAIALDRLQGEHQCYLGLLMPTVQQVQKKIMTCSATLTHCSLLAQALAKAVEVRFSYLFSFTAESEVFAAAAACHPKFKLRWVPDSRKEWVKEALLHEAKKLAPVSTATVTSECEPVAHASTTDDFFDFDYEQTAPTELSTTSKITMECLRYLEEPCSDSLDVLNQYPSVKSLFRKINATVPSSAPFERLFSAGSLVCTPRRNRLTDNRFEQLLLLKTNNAV